MTGGFFVGMGFLDAAATRGEILTPTTDIILIIVGIALVAFGEKVNNRSN